MRMGSVIYIIPFIFVLDAAFILQGPWYVSLQAFTEALLGAWLICAGLQGYLAGLGSLNLIWTRWFFALGGLAIALPELNWVLDNPPSNLTSMAIGTILVGLAILGHRVSTTTNTPNP